MHAVCFLNGIYVNPLVRGDAPRIYGTRERLFLANWAGKPAGLVAGPIYTRYAAAIERISNLAEGDISEKLIAGSRKNV